MEGDKENDVRARRKQGKGAVVIVSTAGKKYVCEFVSEMTMEMEK